MQNVKHDELQTTAFPQGKADQLPKRSRTILGTKTREVSLLDPLRGDSM